MTPAETLGLDFWTTLVTILATSFITVIAVYAWWFAPAFDEQQEEISMWRERALKFEDSPHSSDAMEGVKLIADHDWGDARDFFKDYDSGDS